MFKLFPGWSFLKFQAYSHLFLSVLVFSQDFGMRTPRPLSYASQCHWTYSFPYFMIRPAYLGPQWPQNVNFLDHGCETNESGVRVQNLPEGQEGMRFSYLYLVKNWRNLITSILSLSLISVYILSMYRDILQRNFAVLSLAQSRWIRFLRFQIWKVAKAK